VGDSGQALNAAGTALEFAEEKRLELEQGVERVARRFAGHPVPDAFSLGSDDEGEYEPLDLDWLKFKDTASCSGDKAPGAKNDAEAEEMRDVAADEEFLGELGLDRQGFMSLLGGTGM